MGSGICQCPRRGRQLFAELLHYPVAIAESDTFPSVLGKCQTPGAALLTILPLSRHHRALSPSGGETEPHSLCFVSRLISLEKYV